MIKNRISIILSTILLFTGCVEEFDPVITEEQSLLVVEGLLTDSYGEKSVRISYSMPIDDKYRFDPVKGAKVSIIDDKGASSTLYESSPGIYTTFLRGIAGRKYTLLINTGVGGTGGKTYSSLPVEMKPVPPIDSMYYKKVIVSQNNNTGAKVEACQIYLDTYDKSGVCRYFRWEYEETWEFRLPYAVENSKCWISENSEVINIKSTEVLSESRIISYPIRYITNETDRLVVNYSILVKQYSLSADEYEYWDKMKTITQDIGGLYDIIPASLTGNVICIDDPSEKVLGFFSVSAETSGRIFVRDRFAGQPFRYGHCPNDTIWPPDFPPGPGAGEWVIVDHGPPNNPAYWITTYNRGCADCTVRGTKIKPPYWVD